MQAGTGAQPVAMPAGVTPPPTAATSTVPPNPSAANMLPPAVPDSAQPAQELPPPPPSGGADSSTANLERLSLGSIPTAISQASSESPSAENSLPAAVRPSGGHDAAAPRQPQTARPVQAARPGVTEPPVETNNRREPPSPSPASVSPVSGQTVAKFKGPVPGSQPAPKPAKRQREVKKAKFVASGAVATRINLGEDGQLPNLVVADNKETKETENEERPTSPVLMIVALVFSVVVSVVMLVAPQGPERSESTSKQESIQHIQEHYIGTGSDLKPYQELLRAGIQAERRGDRPEARAAFREVLRMLRAETRGEMGLTAPKWANVETVPNDRDLEKHLNVLLADD